MSNLDKTIRSLIFGIFFKLAQSKHVQIGENEPLVNWDMQFVSCIKKMRDS